MLDQRHLPVILRNTDTIFKILSKTESNPFFCYLYLLYMNRIFIMLILKARQYTFLLCICICDICRTQSLTGIISWKFDHFSRVPFFNCTFVIANDIENLGGIFNLGYSTAYFEGIWNTTVCALVGFQQKSPQSKDYHSIHGGLKSEQFEIPQIRAHNPNVSKTDILKFRSQKFPQ